MKIRVSRRSRKRGFQSMKPCLNDRQDRQIKVARKAGLQEAPSTRSDIEGMLDQLEKVKNGRAYSLAPMSHSVPYLRPNAKAALD